MSTPIPWAARLPHVREVSLLGTADLGYWSDRLRTEGLRPRLGPDARAQLLIIAAESRFRGIPFRELSVSVLVEPPASHAGREAAFLVHAYNSNRFFAWCERQFFSTPYSRGDVRVSAGDRVSIQLAGRGGIAFEAVLGDVSSSARQVSIPERDECWDGLVHLPGGTRCFQARITGWTRFVAFVPDRDTLRLRRASGCDATDALIASRFSPREWLVRPDAAHAKSKTVSRAVLSDEAASA